jgi:hypothetical protein
MGHDEAVMGSASDRPGWDGDGTVGGCSESIPLSPQKKEEKEEKSPKGTSHQLEDRVPQDRSAKASFMEIPSLGFPLSLIREHPRLQRSIAPGLWNVLAAQVQLEAIERGRTQNFADV